MDKYGAVLKKRIKEMGYTQEKFAEETGVPYSTLKKYLSGKAVYSIDLLKLFAEKLDCSYDYLMGYTVSTKRELQDIKDLTRLSDKALERLKKFGEAYADERGKKLADSISVILEADDFIESAAMYFYETEALTDVSEWMTESMVQQMHLEDQVETMPIEGVLLAHLVGKFAKCKALLEKEPCM
jgi:transcriptional regulator with XRE-family HTH domain